jgi:deoxycytidylate deaminase
MRYDLIMLSLKHLRTAYDLARKHKFDPYLEYNLCAVIVRGGNVLSVGYNNQGWNPLSERYKVQRHACNIHAEIDAVISKRNKVDFNGAKIYIVRLKRDATVGNAKPCQMCENVLIAYGIKKAIYSISTNEYGILRLV